jgi:hypothetical protein
MRLVSFGCSLTYGHGLSDCIISPIDSEPNPSKLAWPAIIASELKIELLNLATPGASNKRIWYNIINFNFKKDDIVFIMWSYPERHCILNERNYHKDIGRWNNKFYYDNYYSKYDATTMSKLFVDHANNYLNQKKIVTFNLTITKDFKNIFFSFDKRILHIPIYINIERDKFDLAVDNKHPNEKCHKEIARLIMNELKIDNRIPKQKQLSVIHKLKKYLKLIK